MSSGKNSLCLFFLLIIFAAPLLHAQTRHVADFDDSWRFILGDVPDAKNQNYPDDKWRSVQLPHDWSIEGRFDEHNPATTGGGALPGGVGWYRKTFSVPASSRGKEVFIDFDGVYLNSEVWINGQYLGKRPYGYSSFQYNLSPYLKFGNEKNSIAVRVDNSLQPNSRWYSGSGIYRNVWLVTVNKIHVEHWGVYITTPQISPSSATIDLQIKLAIPGVAKNKLQVSTDFYDSAGKKVGSVFGYLMTGQHDTATILQTAKISNPVLWSDKHPYLYRAVTKINSGGLQVDDYATSFGIRSFAFDPNRGFLLNGKQVKINGVCDHHDLGCLGAAVYARALQRQLEILKKMGCNGIRTSHNPPAPELLDLCDKMGFIVMDEAFDMWKKEKNPYDYHLYWDQWHKTDLEDMVLRDRNHPSVFIWSIGNEIPEQGDTTGMDIAKELAGIIRALDTTRPVTSAMNDPSPSNFIFRSGALDLVGFNYHHDQFGNFGAQFPGKKFLGTETVSALETRGHYDMPSDSIRRWPTGTDYITLAVMNKDLTVSAYDNISTPWGSTHEETWKQIKKYGFLSGMYIWTGFDYLGEPTPYSWPARSSYFGIIDLAGFPKDVYYMYQSEWTEKPVLHIFPHWNWKPGKLVDVWAYYSNADEVELFLNGKSVGVRKKKGEDLHVMWRLLFEPGTLKAVSRKNGKPVLTREINTAGSPARIVLTADRNKIKADAKDLSFITVSITDEKGNLVPTANNEIQYTVAGVGIIAGVDNGNETCMESFKGDRHSVFNGLGLLVIAARSKPGNIIITASSPGLASATVQLVSK